MDEKTVVNTFEGETQASESGLAPVGEAPPVHDFDEAEDTVADRPHLPAA